MAGALGKGSAPAGRTEIGNIDLMGRPVHRNPDGSISTVNSMSANFGNGEVLMPTVSPTGQMLTPEQAMQLYRRSGQHLGIFDTPDNATAYADWLHNQQARMYGDGSQ